MDLVYQPLPEEIELLMKLFVNQSRIYHHDFWVGSLLMFEVFHDGFVKQFQ
jgi:hypothetical protein